MSETSRHRRLFRSARRASEGLSATTGGAVSLVLTPDLQSTYALDLLKQRAETWSKGRFVVWGHSIFGADLPVAAYASLHDGAAELENPPIDVVPEDALDGHAAAYDRIERRILVGADLVRATETSRDAAAKLFVALLEEFGHHLDQVLREDMSSVGGDASWDEGAAFAHSVAFVDFANTRRIRYGTVSSGDTSRPLELAYEDLHEAARRYLDQHAIDDDQQDDGREYFGAGEPKGDHRHTFTHQTIEERAFGAMTRADKFSEREIKRIYFGNWTRDYSQLVDPKITEPDGGSAILAFKRSTLTRVVDVFAEVHFGRHADFHVTEDVLGVYRPEEHIDNPRGISDASAIDPDFRGAWTSAEIAIDATTGLKKYIATEGGSWVTSTGYIREEIHAALAAGRNRNGLRHLGNALHTLEDYFAHSNFCEVALREVGHTQVDPWVPVPANGRIPITTGVFGGLDTAGTIMLEVGEMLQDFDPFDPGARPATTKIFIILLREENPELARNYQWFVTEVETFKERHPALWWILHNTIGRVVNGLKWVVGGAIRGIGNQIDEYQSTVDENGTDPTHSQLAKDHLDHHFHELASLLAIEATRQVGERMIDAWAGRTATPTGGGASRAYDEHKVSTGETLASLAAEAGISWQELAEFNWNTSVPSQINVHLRDDVGCTTMTADGRNYVFTDDADPGILRIPRPEPGAPPSPADVAASFLAHPTDATWGWRSIVERWAVAHPRQVERGASRVWYEHELHEWQDAVDGLTQGARSRVDELWNLFREEAE